VYKSIYLLTYLLTYLQDGSQNVTTYFWCFK